MTPVDARPAGFWIRLAAYMVDSILASIVMWVLLFGSAILIYGYNDFMTMLQSEEGPSGSFAVIYLLVVAVLFFGYPAFVSSAWQATPGKRLLGLYVVNKDGHRVGYGRALWRNICYFFSVLTIYIGFLMIGFTREKRGLHDFMAGTRVLKGRPNGQERQAADWDAPL